MSGSGSVPAVSQSGPSGVSVASNDPTTIGGLIALINGQSGSAVNQILKTHAPLKGGGETVLTTLLEDGRDPLDLLDAYNHTLCFLYILSARINTPHSPSIAVIEDFCARFNPLEARHAPDRVTTLARGIQSAAHQAGRPKLALTALFDLVTRYPPSLAYLTTLHSIFLSVCVETRHFATALPVLEVPVTMVDLSISDLHYSDNLVYHYAGGIALSALKRWREAEDFFEICVTAPGQAAASLQLEAYKKLVLVQLILYGEAIAPPKYTHQVLQRLLKGSAYGIFSKTYPSDSSTLQSIVTKHRDQFATDKNTGLVNQALERAPRWIIKKLTSTYLTLGLGDIAKQVKLECEEKVREIVVSMIEDNEINASISVEGIVTFSDSAPDVPKNVDALLKHAQEQAAFLVELERKMLANKDYLVKALKNKDEGWGAEDDAMFGLTSGSRGGGSGWVE